VASNLGDRVSDHGGKGQLAQGFGTPFLERRESHVQEVSH
jgi:hypothetical protein